MVYPIVYPFIYRVSTTPFGGGFLCLRRDELLKTLQLEYQHDELRWDDPTEKQRNFRTRIFLVSKVT